MASHPVDALRALLPDDITGMDAARAGDALRLVKTCRGVLDAYEAQLTRHITALHQAGVSAPAADLHTRDGGVSSKEARQKERRARALEQAPSLADKLATGEITASHADALADVTARLDDDTRAAFFDHQAVLADDATRRTPEEFARSCRDLIRHIERDQGLERDRRQRRDTRLTTTIDRDGMYVLNARLHPELGHAVFTALDAETARLVRDGGDRTIDRAAIAAEALGNLITGGHQAIRPVEAEIRLHIDEQTLTGDIHDRSICEYDDGTPLPLATAQRLVCNGHIIPIILDTHGNVINVGRTQRLANRTQRRALRAMYPTCAFHGCDIRFNRCEIHHLHPYEHGGRTDLQNLLPLCSRHHHVIHDLHWALELDPHRTLTIRRHDGTIHATVPLPTSTRGITADRVADAGPPTGPPGPTADRSTSPPDGSPGESRARPPGPHDDRAPERPPGQLSLIA